MKFCETFANGRLMAFARVAFHTALAYSAGAIEKHRARANDCRCELALSLDVPGEPDAIYGRKKSSVPLCVWYEERWRRGLPTFRAREPAKNGPCARQPARPLSQTLSSTSEPSNRASIAAFAALAAVIRHRPLSRSDAVPTVLSPRSL